MSYDKLKTSELNTTAQTEEELDVIEVLDHRALFSNGRIKPEQIPEGLHAYDLRHSDDGGRFCSIEPKVGVNHGGTVLMRMSSISVRTDISRLTMTLSQTFWVKQ